MSPEPPSSDDQDPHSNTNGRHGTIIEIHERGDLVLDVTFETSPAVLKKSRRPLTAAAVRCSPGAPSQPAPKPTTKVAYRVSIDALKKKSRYFVNLFSNSQFHEAQVVAKSHQSLAAKGLKPSEASAQDLPHIAITDDDEATQTAGREPIFEDLLRILHQKPIKTAKVVMSYAVTIAIMADRFDCVPAVSHAVNSDHKFKWPITNTRPLVDDRGRSTDIEQVLRQKVLVSWLLCQPLRLQQATRELIFRGSALWGVFHEADDDAHAARSASWWHLPDGLEEELQYRRECILNTIASVQRHFLTMYASRDRQCKLGYDSSAACDSFQLGQLLKFLTSKGLLHLVDFGPASLDSVADSARIDLEELLSTLKQCPNYQIDRHHTNCGAHIRVKPVMDYIRSMLSANAICISQADWKRRRSEVSWMAYMASSRKGHLDDEGGRAFAFTRAIASDQRLQHEGAFHADRMARNLFTADSWDWTPET